MAGYRAALHPVCEYRLGLCSLQLELDADTSLRARRKASRSEPVGLPGLSAHSGSPPPSPLHIGLMKAAGKDSREKRARDHGGQECRLCIPETRV